MGADIGSGNSIKALERGFRIVEILREHEELTLTEVSEFLDISTSTVHSYLKTLEREGLLVSNGRKYHNGLKFLEYGGYARQQLEVYDPAKQVMHDLAAQTRERVVLGVEENGKRVLIGFEDGTNAVTDNIPIGEFTEMHWTGSGKCILAHLPEPRREGIIESSDLPRATENTITDPEALRRELTNIRDQGYAISDEERREGMRGVNVPVLTPDDELLCSIGVSGPVSRFDAAKIPGFVDLLTEHANVIKLKTTYY